MTRYHVRGTIGLSLALLLGACATPPTPPDRVLSAFDPVAAVAAIRAVGVADATELSVQPLRDPQVEDLRQQAAALEGRRLYPASADALDRALAITPDDPALLQERAEVALLLRDLDAAERHALRAFEIGSQVGPLCRRHWETVAQVRSLRGSESVTVDKSEKSDASPAVTDSDPLSALTARRNRDACTVTPPPRY